MAKRPGKGQHDATQELSTSQLLPTDSVGRPVLHRGSAGKNDMSIWGGVVVGTSDFAPPPAKKGRSNTWKWIVGGVGAVVAGVAAFLIVSGGSDKSSTPAKAAAPVTADAAVAVVPRPAPDAAVVAQAVDAGAPIDAAPTIVAVTGEADAISGVGPVIKPAKKKVVRKTTAKKPAPKKMAPKRK